MNNYSLCSFVEKYQVLSSPSNIWGWSKLCCNEHMTSLFYQWHRFDIAMCCQRSPYYFWVNPVRYTEHVKHIEQTCLDSTTDYSSSNNYICTSFISSWTYLNLSSWIETWHRSRYIWTWNHFFVKMSISFISSTKKIKLKISLFTFFIQVS